MLAKLKGSLEKKENEIIGIASTETADRDGEIIKQDGWDLKNFKQNPVILASHNYHDFPIGKAINIRVEDGKLLFKMAFSEATERAREAMQLVQEGILKAFSVGFIPREYDEKNQNVITKAELLEISLVSVPANPKAIVIAKEFKENNLAKHLIKEWLLDEKTNEQVKELEKLNSASGDEDIKAREESTIIDAEVINVRLLQKATGHLQTLLHEIKKGGAKK